MTQDNQRTESTGDERKAWTTPSIETVDIKTTSVCPFTGFENFNDANSDS